MDWLTENKIRISDWSKTAANWPKDNCEIWVKGETNEDRGVAVVEFIIAQTNQANHSNGSHATTQFIQRQ